MVHRHLSRQNSHTYIKKSFKTVSSSDARDVAGLASRNPRFDPQHCEWLVYACNLITQEEEAGLSQFMAIGCKASLRVAWVTTNRQTTEKRDWNQEKRPTMQVLYTELSKRRFTENVRSNERL